MIITTLAQKEQNEGGELFLNENLYNIEIGYKDKGTAPEAYMMNSLCCREEYAWIAKSIRSASTGDQLSTIRLKS